MGTGTPSSSSAASALGLFVATVVAVLWGGNTAVFACPVCFGAEESSIVDGAKIGILVLLAITFAVQGGFLGFFFYLRRRARLNREEDLEAEWSELQRVSRTS